MRRLVAVAFIAAVTIGVTGCTGGHSRQPLDEIKEAAESRQVCHDEGGSFVQWMDGFNEQQWYCDFSDEGGGDD